MSEARHPLAHLATPGRERLADGNAGVALSERRAGSIVEMAYWPDAIVGAAAALRDVLGCEELPGRGRAIAVPGAVVMRLAPGRVLAVAQAGGLAARLVAGLSAEAGVVTDLSGGRAGVRLAGPRAEAVLQKGLAIDLHPAVFEPLSVLQGAIHHMGVTVLRLDGETFDLLVSRSFAVSLWDWVTDAASEYGWKIGAPVA